MLLSDIRDRIRYYLNDRVAANYRFTNDLIIQYVNEAVREIRRLRPDAQLASDGTLSTFTGCYEYAETGSHDDYTSGYNRILAWDRETNTTLYMKAITADQIKIYISSGDRTGDTNEQAVVNNCTNAGKRRIEEANSSGWLGTISVDSALTLGEEWEAEALEADLTLDEVFEEAVIHFTVSRCFTLDSEDTADYNLGEKHFQLFRAELGV